MNNHKAIAFFSGFPERRFTEEIAMRLKKELTILVAAIRPTT
jgi:hypothetical protein